MSDADLIQEARYARGAYPLDSETVSLLDRLADALEARQPEDQIEYEYGVDWGDGGVTAVASFEHAQKRASKDFGDVIVRRRPSYRIPASPWEPVPEGGDS